MNISLSARGDQTFLEGAPQTPLLQSADDVVDLIGACFEHNVRTVLLYAENLPDRFFDLSSGEAGTILQKLRNYRIRLALVVPQSESHGSDSFRAMAAEESRGNDFRIFADRDSAEAWLTGEH